MNRTLEAREVDSPMSEQVATVPTEQGILAREEQEARQRIAAALADLGVSPRGPIDLRPIPFAGTWGVATSVCHQLAGEMVQSELEAAGTLEGLSKKEAKKLAADSTRAKAQELATEVAWRLSNGAGSAGIAQVEAAN